MPGGKAPGVSQKYWEKHFLDLYAPTPPPLLSPRVPRMKRTGPRRARHSLLETAAAAVPLPAVLSHGEHIRPLITSVLDSHSNPIPFHDVPAEEEAIMKEREVDMYAPAHPDGQQTMFLELDEETHSSEQEGTDEPSLTEEQVLSAIQEIATPFQDPKVIFDTSVPVPPKMEQEITW